MDRLELSRFEQAYSLEGGELYAPELMLSVWLYAYAVGLTSARRLEQRLVEDLALRYLAGGARVDNWALSGFRRRHAGAINDAFTQVLEMARQLGWGKLGRVAIDATRIKANACRERVDTEPKLRNERAKLRRQVRRWQQACDGDDAEPSGLRVALEKAERRLAEMPGRLAELRKSGLKKRSRTDEQARFLRQRGGNRIAQPVDRSSLEIDTQKHPLFHQALRRPQQGVGLARRFDVAREQNQPAGPNGADRGLQASG